MGRRLTDALLPRRLERLELLRCESPREPLLWPDWTTISLYGQADAGVTQLTEPVLAGS